MSNIIEINYIIMEIILEILLWCNVMEIFKEITVP